NLAKEDTTMKLDSMTWRMAFGFAVATATMGGCGKDAGDDFRDGVPQHEDVALVVPGGDSSSGALTAGDGASATHGALLGLRSEMYTITRGITVVVNTGTVAVLTLVRTITEYPPTSVQADTAVWGPYTEPLSP